MPACHPDVRILHHADHLISTQVKISGTPACPNSTQLLRILAHLCASNAAFICCVFAMAGKKCTCPGLAPLASASLLLAFSPARASLSEAYLQEELEAVRIVSRRVGVVKGVGLHLLKVWGSIWATVWARLIHTYGAAPMGNQMNQPSTK